MSLSSLLLLFGFSIGLMMKEVCCDSGTYTDGDMTDSTDDRDYDEADDDCDCLDKLECYQESLECEYANCGGYYGCYESDLTVDKDAYIDGLRGGQETDISTGDDLYCGGYVGCYMSEMNIAGDVICDGAVGCYNSLIYSTGDVYLIGFKAATSVQIFGNVTGVTLYGYGSYSALYSTINKVTTIYNFGLYGMYFADIFTDKDTTFTMYNYGRLSTYYGQLYCKHGTTCNIYCRDYGCYDFEIRAFKFATVNVYYNDEDCDSEPTVLYAKNSQEEAEFEALAEKRLVMKNLAREQFHAKYKKEMKIIENKKLSDKQKEHLLANFDIEAAFDEIIENIKIEMDLMDGGKTYDINNNDNAFIAQSDNINNEKTIIVTSEHANGNDNEFKFEFIPALCGIVGGIIALAAVLYIKSKCFDDSSDKLSQITKLNTNSNGYTYHSI